MEDSSINIFVSYLNNENEVSKPHEIVLDKEKMSSADLQAKIGETIGIPVEGYTVFFGLKKLKFEDDKSLTDYGLRSGSRLHAVQKKVEKLEKEPEIPELAKVQNAARGLHLMFQHNPMLRRLKSPIVKFLEDRGAMEEIISSIEGLSDDRTALDILKNPKLFKVMINPKNMEVIIQKHPCLASAFISIWNSIMTSNRSSNFDAALTRSSQDNMEVDDRFLSPPSGSQQASTSRGNVNQSTIITSSQLASAIAQATSQGGASGFPYSAYNTPTPASNTQSPMPNSRSAMSTPTTRRQQTSSQPPLITPDVFSQAMQQALVSTGLQEVAETLQSDGGATASGSSISEDVLQAGLDQLRSMGITDEAASRQALTVTQGNVEAAVNLLFSGN